VTAGVGKPAVTNGTNAGRPYETQVRNRSSHGRKITNLSLLVSESFPEEIGHFVECDVGVERQSAYWQVASGL